MVAPWAVRPAMAADFDRTVRRTFHQPQAWRPFLKFGNAGKNRDLRDTIAGCKNWNLQFFLPVLRANP